MDDSSNESSDIIGFLEELEQVTRKQSKQQAVRASQIVEKVTAISCEKGLSDDALNKLVDLVTLPNSLDQGKKSILIRNLYPSSRVSNNVAFKAVCGLGHGQWKPSYTLQSMLLKWLIMIYDIIEDKNAFSQVYTILFNLLDTASLRPQLCHLLAMITRRKHIRPYRIQQLMELRQKVGNESPLIELMRVFKNYCPDFFIGLKPDIKASVIKHADLEWKQRLFNIQQISAQKIPGDQVSGIQNARIFSNIERTNLHLSSILPEIHSSSVQDFCTTLKELDDVEKFVMSLEKIESPSQLVAVIGDSFLQNFLQLRNSARDTKRVEYWLLAFFQEHTQNSSFDSKSNLEMLRLILEYTRFKKILPTAFIKYLKFLLPSWDGLQGRTIILDLLEYTPLESFSDLSESIFQPLEAAILDETIESKIDLIKFFTALLNRWTTNILANPNSAPIAEPSFTALIRYANKLTLTTLVTSNTVATASTALNFYETTASIAAYGIVTANLSTLLPHPEAIYILGFTSSLSNLSRICAILSIHKHASEPSEDLSLNTLEASPDQHSSKKQEANSIKCHLTDFCNFLWLSQAFITTGLNSRGCLLPPIVTQTYRDYLANLENPLILNSLFSLSFSPVTCLLADSYFAEMEDRVLNLKKRHSGVITPASLKLLQQDGGLVMTWKTFQSGALDYLEEKGVTGLSELIHLTTHISPSQRENN